MSAVLQFKLTQTGQTAVWNANNTGLSLNLTHIEFGSGNRAPTGTESALVSPQQAVAIAAGFSVSRSQIRMSAIFAGDKAYVIREVGLWSGDPAIAGSKLVGYWSQAAGDLASKSSGVDFIFSHDMTLDDVVPAGSLTIVADSDQSAMLAMITAHEAAADPHPQYLLASEAPASNGIALGGVDIPDFSLTSSTPNQRVVFDKTNPAGWNTDAGCMTVDFELQTSSFFAANPTAHFFVVLRNTTSLAGTPIRGQGIGVGNLTQAPDGTDLNPSPMLETWMNSLTSSGAPSDQFLWKNSETARSLKFLDGVRYKFNISSSKTADGNRFLRYRVWSRQGAGVRGGGTQQWRAEVDTGDVLDHNIWADLTQSGLSFAYVFQTNLSPWSINISKCKVVWGPINSSVADQTIKLSRFGAQLEGDLQFIGNGRTIKVITDNNNDWSNWTAFQTQTSNLGSTVLVKPNGTAKIGNFTAVNTSTPSATWQAAIFGMDGSQAVMQSYGKGMSDPELGFRVGATQIARISTDGLYVKAAALPIGRPIASFYNFSNWRGYNASNFTDYGGFNMETACAVGWVSNFIGPAYSPGLIENVIRPLYCMISTIVGELKSKAIL